MLTHTFISKNERLYWVLKSQQIVSPSSLSSFFLFFLAPFFKIYTDALKFLGPNGKEQQTFVGVLEV
jgi:hypothetical protein